MEKEGLTNYALSIVVILILMVLIPFADVFGNQIKDSTNSAMTQSQEKSDKIIAEAATAFNGFELSNPEETESYEGGVIDG